MSGGAGERMRRVLNGTGCYRLTGETSADWELNACAAGLDALDGEIDALLADLFPDTAGEEQLLRWERLWRPEPAQVDAETRREMVRRRLAMRPEQYTLADYSALIYAAGVAGQVLLDEDGLLVVVGRALGLPRSELERELDQLLPAHLPWALAEPVNWIALDHRLPEFQVFDRQRRTWKQLDAMNRAQLEAYFE